MIPLITRQHKKPTFNLALLKTKYSFDLIDNFLASLNALDYQITSLEVFEDYLSDFSDEVLREAKKAVEKAIEKANITNKSPDEVAELISELEDIERTQEETSDDEQKRKEMYEREREYWEEEARKTAEDEAGRPLDDLTEEIIRETEETARETEAIEEEVVETGGAGGVINTETGTSGTAGGSGRTESTGETAISRAREQVERDREATQTLMDSVTIENQNPESGTITTVHNPTERTWTDRIGAWLTGDVIGEGETSSYARNGETVVITTDTGATVSIKNETGDNVAIIAEGDTIAGRSTDPDGTLPATTTTIEDIMSGEGFPGTTITVNTPTIGGGTATSTVKTGTDGTSTVVTTSTAPDGTKTTTTTDSEGNIIHTAIDSDGNSKTSWTDDNGVTHTNGVGKDSGGNTVGYSQSENDDGVVVTENRDGSGETTSVSFEGTPVEAPANPGDSITIDGIGTITNNGDGTATWVGESGDIHTGTPVVDDDGNITDIVITN